MELTRESIQRKFRPTESYPSVEGTCIRDRLKLLSNVKNSTIIHSLPPDNYPVKDFRQCTNIPKEIDFLIIEDEHSKKEPILMRYYRCDDDILMAAYTLNENIWVVYTAIRLSINEDIVEEFFPGTLISESEREGITIVITELMSGFTTYLTHELKVINPEIIHSPRLKNMSRKDKHKHLIYRFNCDKDINNTPILDKLGQSDTMETTFTTSNKAALMSKIVKAAGLGNTDSAKDILNNISSKDYNSYIGVKIITLTNRQIIITRYEKDKYSVIIKNAIGNKIDEFIINNINNEKFDFI